jgi:CheY-like chemotaxis protein
MEQKYVLLADDDRELCEELTSTLEESGYRVCCVYTGEDAVEKVRQEDFDVALTDLKMPGIGGLEAAKQMKKIKPQLPIIMITGSLSRESRKLMEGEVSPHIVYKPFGRKDIVEAIKRVLD